MKNITEMQEDMMKIANISKNFRNISSLTEFLIKNSEFNNEYFESLKKLLNNDIDRFVESICKSENIHDDYKMNLKRINGVKGTAAEYFVYLLSLVSSVDFKFPKLIPNFPEKIKIFNYEKDCYVDVLNVYHDLFYDETSIEIKSLNSYRYHDFTFGIIDKLKSLKKNNYYGNKTYGSRISRFIFFVDIGNIKKFDDIFSLSGYEIVCIYDLFLKQILWLNIDSNAIKVSEYDPEKLVEDIEAFKDF